MVHSGRHAMGKLDHNLKLRIDEETLLALQAIADDDERTVAAVIRRAIRAYLASLEVAA